ncbi:hypothetical protein GX441_00965 [bacterium]|nr:hypothetical protein [bacterium]
MARTRYIFFESLRRIGTSLFDFFSRCEERGVLPRAARWIKMSALSAIVAGLGTVSAASLLSCCYLPGTPLPRIENASVTPNPTEGADTVKISARATIHYSSQDIIVAKAVFVFQDDTTDMQAVDGNFDSQDEEIEAKLYVGDQGSDTVKINISAANNDDEWGDPQEIDLEITE